MQKSAFFLATSLAATLALSACASKPKPMAEAPAPTPPPPAMTDQGLPPPTPLQQGSLQDQLAAAAGDDRVYFELDSHTLTAEAAATLERQASWLAAHPGLRILVAGNCDERGTREYNLALGARRATAARDLLIARGVSAGRIDTISYGKERPIEASATDAAWSRNRNAHTGLVDAAGAANW